MIAILALVPLDSLMRIGERVAIGAAALLVACVGLYLLARVAPGWNFPIARNLTKIRVGRKIRHGGAVAFLVLSGIGALLHFGRALPDPAAWQGFLCGAGLIVLGVAYLGVLGRARTRRLAFGAAVGTTITLFAVVAIGVVQ
jgi:hypothetical protein